MSIYTTQEQVRSVLQRSLSDQELLLIDDFIESVSQSINAYTGRKWLDIGETEGEEETRVYDGNGKKELFIDDFMSISKLELLTHYGGSLGTLKSDRFAMYPLNTPWKNSIYLYDGAFPNTRAGVRVTGVFYTGAVPSEVQLAAATLVGLVISSSRNVGDFKKESIEGYSYEILTGEEKTNQELASLNRLDLWRKVQL